VLPLDNMSGEPAQQYLSDGITEDIITELARFRGLAVAARHASAQFGAKGVTIADVRRALGVDYVVEGSVRRTGERIRITVQLIDAATGNHIWAERFDRQAVDIYAVLDEVVGAIAANVEDRVVVDAAARARRRPTESWSAYDYLLQGREFCNFHREIEAIPFFERAVAIDPRFALAHGWLGLAQAVSYMFVFDPALLDRAVEQGQRALALDATEATGHWACAMGLTWKRQLDAAGRHFDRAIALNPADLQIRADKANLLRYQGRPEEALAVIDDELRQGPFAPTWFHGVRGRALFDLKRYGDAIGALENQPEKSALAWAYLVAAQGFAGAPSAAAAALAEARREHPGLGFGDVENAEPYAKPAALEHLLEGLRRAGLGS
jgi:adenylate cyclase